MTRQCGDCTKCCEGYLPSKVRDITFFPGKPCHFVKINSGCSIYKNRPHDPCINYKCAWLSSEEIPEWMKPDEINAIIDFREIDGISYLNVVEAGETLKSSVLTFLVSHCLKKNLNFLWEVSGGKHYIGSPEFIKAMDKRLESSNL